MKIIAWLDSDSERYVRVEEGDAYVFQDNVSTRAGFVHPKGSLLFVHDRTDCAPHGEVGPRGHNWICRTQFDVSVWATLEHCIERGLLKRLS